MSPGSRIDYKILRQINPEAARKAVLEYLKTKGGNKADAARVFGNFFDQSRVKRNIYLPKFDQNYPG